MEILCKRMYYFQILLKILWQKGKLSIMSYITFCNYMWVRDNLPNDLIFSFIIIIALKMVLKKYNVQRIVIDDYDIDTRLQVLWQNCQ